MDDYSFAVHPMITQNYVRDIKRKLSYLKKPVSKSLSRGVDNNNSSNIQDKGASCILILISLS